MIPSEYYNNYRGPNLTKAQIWLKNQQKIDITEEIKDLYGDNNNWNGNLYTYKEVFPDKDYHYHFYVEFIDDSGRKHWFNGMVGEPEQYFNPPLASPFNQNLIPVKD